MAIYRSAIFNDLRKKLANTVMYKLESQGIIRSAPGKIRNPRTPEQLNQRAKMSLLVDLSRRFAPIIQEGDQFRLVSPYSGNHAAVMYVTPGQDKAVLFAYDIYAQKYVERSYPIRLQGLDPQRSYRVVEINKMDSVPARPFVEDGKTFSGEYLMKIGLQAFSDFRESSRVIEITAQ